MNPKASKNVTGGSNFKTEHTDGISGKIILSQSNKKVTENDKNISEMERKMSHTESDQITTFNNSQSLKICQKKPSEQKLNWKFKNKI